MLAKTSIGGCADFKVRSPCNQITTALFFVSAPRETAAFYSIDALWQETVQVIARVGFKMFLNVNANVTAMNLEGTECK